MNVRSPDREVIPAILNAGDPHAQDEALFTPGNYAHACRYAGFVGDEATWDAAERRFHDVVQDVLGGLRSWDDADLATLATRLGVNGPRHHDTRPGRLADATVPDEVLCDIVEDAVPEAVMLLERVTGEPGMPARPPLGAIAALAFVNCGIEGTRPVEGWMDDEEDRALVQAVRVVDDAPVAAWADGECLLPVIPKLRPPASAFAGMPARFVGRAYQVHGGWAFSGVVPLPAGGSSERLAEVLERRMTLELWQLRRGEPRSTFEDVLRHRPEVVYRSALEAAAWLGAASLGSAAHGSALWSTSSWPE